MVVRSLVLLLSAVLVGTSPNWLNALGSLWGAEANAQSLPFSMYWIAVPGALAVGVSWVFEMGINQSPVVQTPVGAGGFDWTKPAADRVDRRETDKQPNRESKLAGSTSVWRRLEADFREILQFGADLSATWERTSTYTEAAETWRISGDYEAARLQKKFTELAETAGRMLVEWPGYTPPLSPATARQTTGRNRWLCAIRDREIKTETWAPGQLMQSDNVTGHIHGGMIRGAIEASVELCLQLSLEESLDDRPHATAGRLGAQMIDSMKRN